MFLSESPVLIDLGKIQDHSTSRPLPLLSRRHFLDCCVRWARHCRRFDDPPSFDDGLGFDGTEGPGLNVPPGLGGRPGLDARCDFLDSHRRRRLRALKL